MAGTSAGPACQRLAQEPCGAERVAKLDIGDPLELGATTRELKARLRHLNVMGGCCGTDHRHVEQIASACLPLFGVRPDAGRCVNSSP